MTQEEKQLLLKDICARLPYGVKVSILGSGGMELQACIHSSTIGWYFDIKDAPTDFDLDEIKPYLRSMSSMTEEEKHELYNIRPYFINSDDIVSGTQCNTFIQASECQDWLNEHHFDYRGLIEMRLALEAPEGMYKTE